MSDPGAGALPGYTAPALKAALLTAGASGTIYSLVMPESEAALAHIVDGGTPETLAELTKSRREHWLSRYHEPWTQKQDVMHEAYFARWFEWSSPVVSIRADDFPHRYPTAGASEGIFKIMADHACKARAEGAEPVVHFFDGEYEGFPAYAEALRIRVVRHDRNDWRAVPDRLGPHAQFWISQPSAIDGAAWPHFEAFATAMHAARPDAVLIPDLTYVGSVAREFGVALDHDNIPAVVISHSKPFGGYYHRIGGVLARREYPSLFGNKWFKNLLSLAWGTEMMTRHGVFDLPRRYRPVQQEATRRIGTLLGIAGLSPTDVLLLGTAPAEAAHAPELKAVLRGSPSEQVVRLCLTPTMTCLIDPSMAPGTATALAATWRAHGIESEAR